SPAILSATVVFPVPGLPVKLMCSVGVSCASPRRLRARSTRSSAAISRIRCLTGVSPTSSRSSSANTSATPELLYSSARLTVTGFVSASFVDMRVLTGSALPVQRLPKVGLASSARVRARHVEHWLDLWAVHDEGSAHGLPAARRVEGIEPDVGFGMRLAASRHLYHDAFGIRKVEHRIAPHLPVSVPGMRVVCVLDANRPVVSEAVVHLSEDLLVREIRQEREAALGDTHGLISDLSAQTATATVGTKSEVSVDV